VLNSAERAAILPLLTERYILDLDTSVKLVYGHQEGAESGTTRSGQGDRVNRCMWGLSAGYDCSCRWMYKGQGPWRLPHGSETLGLG